MGSLIPLVLNGNYLQGIPLMLYPMMEEPLAPDTPLYTVCDLFAAGVGAYSWVWREV